MQEISALIEGRRNSFNFDTEFLAYCHHAGLSLDWVFGIGKRPHLENSSIGGVEKADQFVSALKQLDATEQLIVLAGIQALSLGAFDFEGFKRWLEERIACHRAGQELQ